MQLQIPCLRWLILFLILGNVWLVKGQYEPVPLTPGSYNQDVVVEKTAPSPALQVTTASMEDGVLNSGATWFERGYYDEWPATGLPEAGFLLTSDLLADHEYQMPLSYQQPNAVLIDSNRANGLLIFKRSANYTALSFLTSSGVGRNLIHYVINHEDGSRQEGTFTSPNWYNDGDPAWAANGRVNSVTFTHADLNSYNPRLYSVDIEVSNTRNPISNVELFFAGGRGHTAIFAVSGASGGAFSPIEMAGYNEDLVVEASAVKPGFIETNTTATMEAGMNNSRFTWYEQGYNQAAPGTGLPSAGSLVSVGTNSTHRFVMASNYSEANAILLDGACSDLVLVPIRMGRYSALSFLAASAAGPTTNQCVITHTGGRSETNIFVVPDWLGTEPAALTVSGRVNVSTKLIDRQNANPLRLYAIDVPVSQTNVAVTEILLSCVRPRAESHTVIFGVAGLESMSLPPVLSIIRNSAGKLTLYSTQPGRLEFCEALHMTGTHWTNAGSIMQTQTLTPTLGKPTRFYRVVGQ